MTDPNSQTFPVTYDEWNVKQKKEIINPGLTKREYFAIHCLQGLLADHKNALGARVGDVKLGRLAVAHADLLIRELNEIPSIK